MAAVIVPGVLPASVKRPLAALASAIALAGATVQTSVAADNLPRDLTLKYSERKDAFKGKIKSKEPACLPGVVVVQRVEAGPNPIVGSAAAGPGGRWAAPGNPKRGRYYATTESYRTPVGNCPSVRSRTLTL